MLKRLLLFSSCFLVSATLSGQSLPSASGRGFSLSGGVAYSTFNPDYGCKSSSPFSCDHNVLGISPFVDLDHLFLRRLGAEGEMRFLRWGGPANGAITEDSYLAGPRYDLLHLKDRLRGTARLMFGGAHLAVPKGDAGGGGYFVYAPGGIVEFKVTRRVSARAEYEYQIWPTFSGIKTTSTSGTGGLSPNGFSFGVSYEILPPRSGY